MSNTTELIQNTLVEISEMSDIEFLENDISSQEELKNKLTEVITYLIDNDFEKLLRILYRIDVDEEKAKQLLAKNLPHEAPLILADLIIQRQAKKEEIKKQFQKSTQPPDDFDDDLRL